MKRTKAWDIVLTSALGVAYWAALALGNGHSLLWVMAAFPLVAAVFFAFVAQHRGWALLILFAAAALPPATYAFLLFEAGSRPHVDECNMGPLFALLGLMLGGAQVFAIGLLGPLLWALRTKNESEG
jgi:hypothetical protein